MLWQASAVRDQRTKHSVGFGKGIAEEEGLKEDIEKGLTEHRRTV